MARYAMVTDLRKCVGCQACTVACNAEWNVPAGSRPHARARDPARRDVPEAHVQRLRRAVQPLRPPALRRGLPLGRHVPGRRTASCASTRTLCIGCGFCVDACPYDARYINPARRRSTSATSAPPRIERGEEPACVATCTAHAKYFGDLEDRGERSVPAGLSPRAPRASRRRRRGRPERLLPRQARVRWPSSPQSFPPRPPRLPAAGEFWRWPCKPLVLAAVGATFLGQAVAFFTQLAKGENDFEE